MSADISQENLSSLFKDGISEDLYKLLWSKDELNFGPSINIPDTIVYKYGQPTAWYFTAQNGRVKKKNKHNLMSAKIEEVFNKHVLGYDVLAYFINVPNDSDPNSAATPITVEYLDRTALNDFLYIRKKEVNGFLQRFIEPKTTRNEVIRAIWSPKVCLLERAENIHQLHDHRYGLYERCVIYEGPEYYFTSAPLRGPVLSGQIQKLSETIVSHISEVTFGQKQISRIVLNFKVDSRDKIWLLYSTSIRCVDMLQYSSVATSAASRLERTLVNIDSVISLSNTVCLNPIKSYEKILPKARVRCLSCARETLEDMRHPVSYKNIVKHYEHVLYLLSSEGGPVSQPSRSSDRSQSSKSQAGGVMVTWPPDKEIVEAAGGVGFGCLYINDLGEVITSNKLEHTVKVKNVKDLQIPPIIHTIHSKLNLKSYRRCRFDPLFLYKTVLVCEPCYLVYAEFASMLLRMGQDLTKLLTPDPVVPTNSSTLLEKSTLTRPSSADWRAIGTANPGNRSSSAGFPRGTEPSQISNFQPSVNHAHAKSSAIGLRSSEVTRQPEVPKMIRNATDGELAKTYSYYSSNGGVMEHSQSQFGTVHGGESPLRSGNHLEFGNSTISTHNGGGLHGLSSSSGPYGPVDVQAMIAERERHFFKEISLNPQLKDQHPLMHLISAQQKLKLVDQQSGVVVSKTANNTESFFGTKYGKQTGDNFNKFSAYTTEMPYAINGEIILPSKLRERKREQLAQAKLTKQRSLKSLLGQSYGMPDEESHAMEEGEFTHTSTSLKQPISSTASVNTASTTVTATSSVAKASQKHRDFLNNTLKQIEQEVDNAQVFVGKNTASAEEFAANDSYNGGQQVPASTKHKRSSPKKTVSTPLASVPSTDSRRSSSSSIKMINVPDEPPAASSPKKSTTQGKNGMTAKGNSPKKKTPIKAKGNKSNKQQRVVDYSPNNSVGDSGSLQDIGGSLVDNGSLGEQSTESVLMQRWGIEPKDDDSSDSRNKVVSESHALYNAMASMNSLTDQMSLGEQSTESVLMHRWGIENRDHQRDDQSLEEERRVVQNEATSLQELMGENSVISTDEHQQDSDETATGIAFVQDMAENEHSNSNEEEVGLISQKMVNSMLLEATRNIASR